MKLNEYIEEVWKFWTMGGGLMIFEDNDTIEKSLSNIILKKTLGFTLEGNERGGQVLNSCITLRNQSFLNSHNIMNGVLNIHEGMTIAKPKGVVPQSVDVLAISSTNTPCILSQNPVGDNGRVVVDTGYTKLFEEFYKTTAGTGKYFVNAVIWICKADA